jgi:NAD(P)-dependent dehydrogenase (short-subunit alcohol dehydrogenase family)
VQNLSPWLRNTPLAAIREGVDSEQLNRDKALLGGRPATELEIAKLVGLLCSPDAGFSTGSMLNANGGMKFVM